MLITDGLPSYHDAFNHEFYTRKLPQSKHINSIKLDGDTNNNTMERANGEVKDKEKVMREVKGSIPQFFQGIRYSIIISDRIRH